MTCYVVLFCNTSPNFSSTFIHASILFFSIYLYHYSLPLPSRVTSKTRLKIYYEKIPNVNSDFVSDSVEGYACMLHASEMFKNPVLVLVFNETSH
jgi:hypothetical protein